MIGIINKHPLNNIIDSRVVKMEKECKDYHISKRDISSEKGEVKYVI